MGTIITRTNPYVPRAVTIAADGTIWTSGSEPGKDQKNNNAFVIRHFDAGGMQLGGFIPQSTASVRAVTYSDNLASAGGLIGWYPSTGYNYYEISRDGTVQQYPGVPSGPYDFIESLALTDIGQAFVSKHTVVSDAAGKVSHSTELYVLDRNTSTWTAVQLPVGGSDPAATNVLLGGFHNTLALLGKDPTVVRFFKLQ